VHSWNRRNFLQLAGGATAGTLLGKNVYALASAQTEPAKPVAANDHIQIALIGAGGQGQFDTSSSAARKSGGQILLPRATTPRFWRGRISMR